MNLNISFVHSRCMNPPHWSRSSRSHPHKRYRRRISIYHAHSSCPRSINPHIQHHLAMIPCLLHAACHPSISHGILHHSHEYRHPNHWLYPPSILPRKHRCLNEIACRSLMLYRLPTNLHIYCRRSKLKCLFHLLNHLSIHLCRLHLMVKLLGPWLLFFLKYS